MKASAETPFRHPVKVMADDIDQMGHVNNVVYLQWVQDTASSHWYAVADKETRALYKWIVLRHEIDYKSPAYLGDEVTGLTWVGDCNGARSVRFVTLVNARTGKVLAEARTTWCMIDAKTNKPARITSRVTDLL